MDIPVVTTARLVLRGLTRADWNPYAAMWSDARVTEYIGGEPRRRETAWLKFVQSAGFWPLFGYGYWAITDFEDRFYGIGGFASHERGIAELAGFPECGWAFSPASWGQGIASEAVNAIVSWADRALAVETRCLISDDNIGSVKVAQRNGYVRLASIGSDAAVFRRQLPSDGDRAPS